MRVGDVMTRSVVTIEPAAPVKQAAATLAASGFTALPVVDPNGKLVGVVTEADVVAERIPPGPRQRIWGDQQERWPEPPATVGEVMSSPPMTVTSSSDAAELARRMIDRRVRSVPVVDGDRLVGIVTRRDLVRVIGRDDALIAADVRHRLAIYGGQDRWTVRVRGGAVSITDEYHDPVAHHVAEVLALGVPGVTAVTVTPS